MRRLLLLLFALVAFGCNCRSKTSAPIVAHNSATAPSSDAAAPLLSLEQVRASLKALEPLHQPLPKPGPGDWLAEHEERGQTFDEWARSQPVVADVGATRAGGKRRILYIQPLGPLDEAQRKIVELTSAYMEQFFGLAVRLEPPLPLSLVPDNARRMHAEWGHEQLLTGYVLERILAPRLPNDAAAFISFTASDLWPGDGWNFVLGQASLRDRVGVWSIHHNGDPSQGDAAFRRTLLRTMKIAVHETGHMFSVAHCTRYQCVMAGANSLAEADRHPLWLCPECAAKIWWATRAEPLARYRKLDAFCAEHGFADESAFFKRSIATLEAAR